MTIKELKPCPFCGYPAFFEPFKERKGYAATVRCCDCLAEITTITYDTEERAETEAVSQWNRRAESDNAVKWHKFPEERPKEAGEYLVARLGVRDGLAPYYYMAIWGKNDWIDNHDENMKALTNYWFEYDSDWGYCIIADVLAWMPIPKYSEEKTDG